MTEVSGFYRDPVTGLKCKIKPDVINFNISSIVDVKTTRDIRLNEFRKTIWNLRHDFQMAQYRAGAEIISGKKIDSGVFIAIESEAPHEVAVYHADETCSEIGAQDYRRCLDKLAYEMKTGWSRFQGGIENISLPHWVVERYNAGDEHVE